MASQRVKPLQAMGESEAVQALSGVPAHTLLKLTSVSGTEREVVYVKTEENPRSFKTGQPQQAIEIIMDGKRGYYNLARLARIRISEPVVGETSDSWMLNCVYPKQVADLPDRQKTRVAQILETPGASLLMPKHPRLELDIPTAKTHPVVSANLTRLGETFNTFAGGKSSGENAVSVFGDEAVAVNAIVDKSTGEIIEFTNRPKPKENEARIAIGAEAQRQVIVGAAWLERLSPQARENFVSALFHFNNKNTVTGPDLAGIGIYGR